MKSEEDAASIRRIVHNAENIYGLLVSLDENAKAMVLSSAKRVALLTAVSPRSCMVYSPSCREPLLTMKSTLRSRR